MPGDSTATPIIFGDQIFLTTAIKTDREVELEPLQEERKNPFKIERPKNFYQFVVMSLDRWTGKVQWQHIARDEVPHEGHHIDCQLRIGLANDRRQAPVTSTSARGAFTATT